MLKIQRVVGEMRGLCGVSRHSNVPVLGLQQRCHRTPNRRRPRLAGTEVLLDISPKQALLRFANVERTIIWRVPQTKFIPPFRRSENGVKPRCVRRICGLHRGVSPGGEPLLFHLSLKRHLLLCASSLLSVVKPRTSRNTSAQPFRIHSQAPQASSPSTSILSTGTPCKQISTRGEPGTSYSTRTGWSNRPDANG